MKQIIMIIFILIAFCLYVLGDSMWMKALAVAINGSIFVFLVLKLTVFDFFDSK